MGTLRRVVLVAAIALSPVVGWVAEGPVLDLAEVSLAASGFTPGGSVVWFGVSREQTTWPMRVSRYTAVTQVDEKGTAVLELGRVIPERSIWVAIDAFTGLTATAAPAGFPLRTLAFSPETLGDPTQYGSSALAEQRPYLEVMLVRPGVRPGAWIASVGDGGASDADGAVDGFVVLPYAALSTIHGVAPAPQALVAGDRLIAVDERTMELLVGQAGK